MVRKQHQLMLNMLSIPDHQSLLNLMIQTDLVTEMRFHYSICAQLQYSTHMCKNPMHAQVSMLVKTSSPDLKL